MDGRLTGLVVRQGAFEQESGQVGERAHLMIGMFQQLLVELVVHRDGDALRFAEENGHGWDASTADVAGCPLPWSHLALSLMSIGLTHRPARLSR